MSRPLNLQDGTGKIVEAPGGILIHVSATTTTAGVVGYSPSALLLTTTTCKLYINTGTAAAATWTVVGSQS